MAQPLFARYLFQNRHCLPSNVFQQQVISWSSLFKLFSLPLPINLRSVCLRLVKLPPPRWVDCLTSSCIRPPHRDGGTQSSVLL